MDVRVDETALRGLATHHLSHMQATRQTRGMMASDPIGLLRTMAGQMSHDEFLSKRARQDVVAHNRFETLLARAYPSHKPNLIDAVVSVGGQIQVVSGANVHG